MAPLKAARPAFSRCDGASDANSWGNNGRGKAQDISGLCGNLRELVRAQEQQMCHQQPHPCKPSVQTAALDPALSLLSPWARSQKHLLTAHPVCLALTLLLKKPKQVFICGSKEHLCSPNPIALAFPLHKQHETNNPCLWHCFPKALHHLYEKGEWPKKTTTTASNNNKKNNTGIYGNRYKAWFKVGEGVQKMD